MGGRFITTTPAVLFCILLATLCMAQEKPPAKLDPKVFDPYLGTYQTPTKELIVIARTERRLYFYEPQTGRIRSLELLSQTTFRAGPSLLIYTPAELQITFERNARGDVTSLNLSEAGAATRVAKKASFYKEEQVSFRSKGGEATLAGTLLIPSTKGPHPAICNPRMNQNERSPFSGRLVVKLCVANLSEIVCH